jgi:peptidyl-tRNA hydrolase, PTH1 family
MGHLIRLIVGLGNPGAQYADTRHNAGVWLVHRYAETVNAGFRDDRKFFGKVASTVVDGEERKLFIPGTFMNESGRAVAAIAHFYRIQPEEILIAHDELDLPTGVVRFKQGGGLAGHNGLRDVAAALGGSQGFNRIRIGVGHPGDKSSVTGHVLGKASKQDREVILACIDEALRHLPLALNGEMEKAMGAVNGFKLSSD